MRNLLTGYVRKLPIDLRTYLLPFINGLLGGLAAVAFQKAVSTLFTIFWEWPAQQMPPGNFALFSFATILAASIIAGLILTFVSPDAAGSGIPQSRFLERFRIYASQGGDSEILCRRDLDRRRLQPRTRRPDGSYRRAGTSRSSALNHSGGRHINGRKFDEFARGYVDR